MHRKEIKMPTIVAYDALQDASFSLSPGGHNTVHFDPSNDLTQTGDQNRPLLCYRVGPSNNASNLGLKVQINGVDTGSGQTISGTVSRTLMEIISGTINAGNNNITFELNPEGTGSLAISDVVVFYKRFVS
jgi:hypothetical protein